MFGGGLQIFTEVEHTAGKRASFARSTCRRHTDGPGRRRCTVDREAGYRLWEPHATASRFYPPLDEPLRLGRTRDDRLPLLSLPAATLGPARCTRRPASWRMRVDDSRATARVVGGALVPDVCSLGLVRGVWGLAYYAYYASGLWPARGVVEILRACFGLAVGRLGHVCALDVADDGGTRSPSVGLFSSGVFHGAL